MAARAKVTKSSSMTVVTASDGLDRYKRLEKLGEGTYGLVYKARDLVDNTIVAIKKIKLDNNEEGIPATTMREISLLSHLKHPNIVEMSGCLCVDGELYLVFEYMTCDLKGFLDNLEPSRFLDRRLLKKLTYYLTEGIRHCHARRILHRDLKPQNILISDDHQVKIADFGLGREHGLPICELTHEVVTLWYRPPEILLGKKRYSGSCDVWGIGCILSEMATKSPLFVGDSEIDQLFQIYRVMGTPNPKTWPGIEDLPEYKSVGPKWKKKDLGQNLNGKLDATGCDLLEQSLILAPHLRITAKRMLLHEWFDEIREEMIAQFGNVFPHCGSREFQVRRIKAKKAKAKGKSRKPKKMDLDKENSSQSSNVKSGNNNDDEDVTSNAEEWNAAVKPKMSVSVGGAEE